MSKTRKPILNSNGCLPLVMEDPDEPADFDEAIGTDGTKWIYHEEYGALRESLLAFSGRALPDTCAACGESLLGQIDGVWVRDDGRYAVSDDCTVPV